MWLNEGFATYGTYLWEELGNDKNIDEVIADDLTLRFSGAPELLGFAPATPDPTERGIFAPHVYYRGALVVHAMRRELGDERFFQFLKSYFNEFQDSNISTPKFLEFTKSQTDANLDQVFDTWLFGEELPESLGDLDLSDFG